MSEAHAVSEADCSLLLLSRAKKYELVSTLVSVQLVDWEQKSYVSCSFLNFTFARVYLSELAKNNPSELT